MGPQPGLTFTFHNFLKDHTTPTLLEGNLVLMEWILLFLLSSLSFSFFFFFQFTMIIFSHILGNELSLLLCAKYNPDI